jgi:hypothetical protein
LPGLALNRIFQISASGGVRLRGVATGAWLMFSFFKDNKFRGKGILIPSPPPPFFFPTVFQLLKFSTFLQNNVKGDVKTRRTFT